LLQEDRTAEAILKRLSDTKNYPDDTLDPYLEFSEGGNLYYFTPGGFLYRREEPGMKEVGGVFCGYLTDEVWHYRTGRCTNYRACTEITKSAQKLQGVA
jgi:hypothetical protein